MATINDKFFADLAGGATWAAGVSFQRSNPLPLDKYSVFESLEKLDEYALENAVAYPGQVVAAYDAEEQAMKAYILTEAAKVNMNDEIVGYFLYPEEIGTKIEIDPNSMGNNSLGLLEILGFEDATNLTLPQKKDGKVQWLPISEIAKGDGNDNTTYTFALGSDKKSLDITTYENGVAVTDEDGQIIVQNISFDIYTKAETDAAIKVVNDRIGTASTGTVEGGDYIAATGLIADIESLENTKADISYVDDEIAGLEDAISKLNHFTTKIVSSTDEVNETGVLYLIKDTTVTGVDKYNEYLYINEEAVLIGDTTTDLSDYYSKIEVDNAIGAETTAREALAGRVKTLEDVDNATQAEFDAYKEDVAATYAKSTDVASTYVTKDEAGVNLETDKGIRFINQKEIDKLSKLNLSGDEITISGTVNASQVDGLYAAVEKMVTSTNTSEDLDSKVDGVQSAFGIEKGAQVNKIEKVVFNGTEATIADKVATIAGEYYTKTEVDTKVKAVSDTLTEVQSTANTAKSTAEANATELSTLKGTVDGHTTSINKNSADIASLVTKVAIEEGKVGTLESTVASKADSSTVTTLAERVGANEGNITGLTTRVAANETAITSINETLGNKANSADVYTKAEVNAITGTVVEGKTIVDMINDAKTAATYDDTTIKADIKKNTDAIAVLNGDDKTEGSVDYKVTQEVAKIVNENNDGNINTLNEIAAWIVSDTTGAAKMNADIVANTAAITKLNGGADVDGSVLAMIKANAPKVATTELAGLVKSVASTVENGVSVAEDGTMSVNSVNVNKLTQTDGDTLVLNGGSANA